ncbi:MAG: hypothetical protein JWM61_2347 [Micrococcaceae bacterium]|nr:hypothetical protein [Micrococcaceae bacterium]
MDVITYVDVLIDGHASRDREVFQLRVTGLWPPKPVTVGSLPHVRADRWSTAGPGSSVATASGSNSTMKACSQVLYRSIHPLRQPAKAGSLPLRILALSTPNGYYDGGAKNSRAFPSGSLKDSPDPYPASTMPP